MLLKVGLILVFVVALALAIFDPQSRAFTVPYVFGSILGLLLRYIHPPAPERPLKPLGRGWQAVWWALIGLAGIAPFTPILRYFLPLLLIVILWGYWMYRYRRKMGVQP